MLGARRAGGVAELARSIGAVQAQDAMGEVLAVRARSDHLTAADVHRERVESRSVVRTWLMRGTLHLVPSADIRWMLDLLGTQMDRKALKRRANLGVTPDIYADAMTLIGRELAGEALTRAQIIERFREAGLPWEGQVVPHLLRSASLTGLICFGPLADGDDTHVLLDEWLPERTADPPNPAAELARRFFGAYGPATPSDFRTWTGLAAADARAGIDAIAMSWWSCVWTAARCRCWRRRPDGSRRSWPNRPPSCGCWAHSIRTCWDTPSANLESARIWSAGSTPAVA